MNTRGGLRSFGMLATMALAMGAVSSEPASAAPSKSPPRPEPDLDQSPSKGAPSAYEGRQRYSPYADSMPKNVNTTKEELRRVKQQQKAAEKAAKKDRQQKALADLARSDKQFTKG